MSNPGIAAGLAYRHNFDQKVSNYQREEALERARRSEQRAQMKMLYEGIEEMPDVIGSYDREMIKNKYEQVFTKVGELAKNNPNWDIDPDIYTEIQKVKKSLINDSDVRTALTSTEQYKQMQKFIHDHPDANKAEVQKMLQSWRMYDETGTVDGVTRDAFTFVNPGKSFNAEEYFRELGNGMQTNMLSRDHLGVFTTADPMEATQLAYQILSGNSNESFNLRTQFKDLQEKGAISKKTHIVDWAAQRIMANVPKKYDSGMTSALTGGSNVKDARAKPYVDGLFSKRVNRFRPSSVSKLIGYDESNGILKIDANEIPSTLVTELTDSSALFSGNNGRHIGNDKMIPMDILAGREFKARVTGRTALMGENPSSEEGDQTPSSIVGIETELIISTEDEQFAEIAEWMEANNLLKINETFDGHGWFDWGSVDKDAYEFTNKRLHTIGTTVNQDGETVDALKIKVMVPHRYSKEHQLQFRMDILGKDEYTKQYGESPTSETEVYSKSIKFEGETYEVRTDKDGKILTDENGDPIIL